MENERCLKMNPRSIKEFAMSKAKKAPKPTVLEKTQDWIAKHAAEKLPLGPLQVALAAAEARTDDTLEAARKLGEALEAREAAYQTLKDALKAAKAARKAPAPKAPAKAKAEKAPVPPKAPGPGAQAKAGPRKASASPE